MSDNLQPCLRKSGNDLILELRPLAVPLSGQSKRRVLVIGGGVTGLTSAWTLLDAGFGVVVISDKWAPALPRITSQIAGAL
jgi:D-amino-acid oxidase